MNDAELHVIHVVLGDGYGKKPGSFTEALIHTVFKADLVNRSLLRSVYPEIVDAVNSYAHGDLHQRVMAQTGEGKYLEKPDLPGAPRRFEIHNNGHPSSG